MMTFIGFVKAGGVYDVTPKNKPTEKKQMISFTVTDELGNSFACQMWQDDPQFSQLAQVIESARRQPVQFEVAGYTSRLRTFKDGTEKPQTNFIVTRVSLPNMGLQAA
ncbi:hypothetical protein [Dictyobacter kobayashii]|uniref:OB domain-containing protein n=1 Tax=Dictyobacter kobayashii TaxID=2014872 RepID=A0A402AFR7_9CHLR|nr:hypothetical protein [Dictyobacter kobayashii]GCE17951.1 hypothetical protein KDK_17510 [Dictyobacter kobayashii]